MTYQEKDAVIIGGVISSLATAYRLQKCELEIYLSMGRGRNVSWSEKKSEDLKQAEGGGLGIRVIERTNGSGAPLCDAGEAGRQGFAFTTRFEKDQIEKVGDTILYIERLMNVEEKDLVKLNRQLENFYHLSENK